MKTYTFKVVVEPDVDAQGNPAWHAYCPALENVGGATSGSTKEEALIRINEVIHMIVREFVDEGKALPEGPEDSVEVAVVRRNNPAYRSGKTLPACRRGCRPVDKFGNCRNGSAKTTSFTELLL